jgi:hypothetical protein
MSETGNPGDRSLLRRVLGPQGFQLSCEECFAELDRYVELELQRAEADARIPGMREHLEGCSACAEDHRSLIALVEPRPLRPSPARRLTRPRSLRA